jgi:MHS family proline/betaine transporter-like MFS transporter
MLDSKFRKQLAIGMVGNILEAYDFTLYGYLASLFAKLFFPTQDDFTALLSAFCVFSVGFIMRPIGAIYFGSIGDRIGRRRALLLSILCIAIPTILMGLLPTYNQIGIWAPIFLVLLRLLQGFSTGGEYTVSILYLTEHAPQNRKYLAGSFALLGAGIGWLLGSLACSAVTSWFATDVLMAWGWRIPFLLGSITALFSYIIRSKALETPTFIQFKNAHLLTRNPVRDTLERQKLNLLKVMGYNLLPTVAGFILYAYMPSYLNKVAGIPLNQTLILNTVCLILFNALVPCVGFLADRVNVSKILLGASLGFIGLSYMLFDILYSQNIWGCYLAMVVFSFLIAAYHAPIPTLMAQMFPTNLRASSVGIGYNFTVAAFSGTAPLVASLLINYTNNPLSPAYYLMIVATISMSVVVTELLKNKKRVLRKA